MRAPPRQRSGPLPRLLLWALGLLSGAGCPRRAPRVGFQSDAAAVLTRPTDVGSEDAPRFVVVEGRAVAGRALTVDGASIEAPSGGALGVWLPLDLDGDGASGDVAVTLSGAEPTAPPLLIYRREGAGFARVEVQAMVPRDPRCADASLRLTSPRSLVIGWRCSHEASDGGAALAHTTEETLVSVGATVRVRQRAGLLWPPLADAALSLMVEGVDRDGDGVDEVVVNVLAAPAGQRPRATVRAVFFERSGGLARDTSEPSASFAALIERARRAISSRRRSSLTQVLGALDDVSRLRRAVCEGSATARLDLSGSALPCGSVAFGGATEVMARALVAAGEIPAAWALTRQATASEYGVLTSPRALSELRRASVPERGVTARRGPMLGGAVTEGSFGARLGALSFDPQVNPTGLTVRGVSSGRVDLASLTFLGDPTVGTGELLARAPDGATAIVGFAQTCAGLAAARCDPNSGGCLELLRRPAGGALSDGVSRVPLGGPVPPVLAARCLSEPLGSEWLGATARASVLSFTTSGALLSVNGRLATVVGDSVTYGVDGAGAVMAAPEGVWLRDRGAWRLLSPQDLAGRYAELTDLTASGDGRLVAGMLGQEVWVIERARATAR